MADVDIKRDLITIVEDIEGTITREMKKEMRKRANELRKKIQADAPKRKNGKMLYSKGWKVAIVAENDFYCDYVVYSKNRPTLPHLLEKGHRIVVRKKTGAGNYILVDTGKKTRAIPHIIDNADVEAEKLVANLLSKV
jgi:hypothetical protein